MEAGQVKGIVEAALLVADGPLTAEQCVKLFKRGEVTKDEAREWVKVALEQIEEDCADRGIELKRVASGYRFQVRQEHSPWVSRLWDEKPPRYSRALLETLALVAYRQPATRGDIEQVRGVAVSQNIMRTLVERGWIKDVGHREVPGRPTMYGTTKAFLDYFNLKSLNQLPPLEEIRELVEPLIVAETGEELVPGTTPESAGAGEDVGQSADAEADVAADVDIAPDAEATSSEPSGNDAVITAGADDALDADVNVEADAELEIAQDQETPAPVVEVATTDEASSEDSSGGASADEPQSAEIVPLKRNPR